MDSGMKFFLNLNGYAIYLCKYQYIDPYRNSKENGNYFLCLKNGQANDYQIYFSFSNQNIDEFDKDKFIEEFKNFKIINDENAVIVISVINKNRLTDVANNENEERAYLPFLNQFHSILYDANSRLTFARKNVLPTLKLVKRDDTDEKFFDFVETKLGNFASQIDIRNRKFANILEENTDNGGGITNGNMELGQNNDKPKVKKLTSKNTHFGFSSFSFVLLTLVLSIFLGIGIAILLIK